MKTFLARVKERYRLNRPGSDKDTYHIVLDLADSGFAYQVGDCVGVHPTNHPEKVEHILSYFGTSGHEEVTDRKGNTFPFHNFLSKHANLTYVGKKLLKICEVEAATDVIDLLSKNPSLSPDLLSSHLLPLLPRLYSIASSLQEVGPEAHLTVQRVGTCSNFLCHLAPLNKPIIPIYHQEGGDFTLHPDSRNKPIIMIGPGTGIAPFRGFMQQRVRSAHAKQNWLFFGERNRGTDFYYEEYWKKLEKGGHLKLDVAFSRDQSNKIYVQHRMLEQSRQLWEWLEQGAYLYVCGDASRMAKDVDATLHTIAQKEGNLSPLEAKAHIKNLKREKRYLRDIY